ncbi:amino acid permease-domain-containing protein [Aspergillus desertorum]
MENPAISSKDTQSLSKKASTMSKVDSVDIGEVALFAQTSYVIFEATVINTLVQYWGYSQSPAILISISLVLYLAINVYRADLFGEAECKHSGLRSDCRSIKRSASDGSTGIQHYYDSLDNILYRWLSLRRGKSSRVCLTNGSDTYAGGSPYVISMQRLRIPVLPSVVNAALITTIVSAGNAYTFNASRSLHALALDGRAPKFLRRGVPYMAVIVVMLLSCLAYLALGSSSAKVLNWILNFCTAATMFNWTVISFTWIRFNAALMAQGIDRKTFLPSVSRFQPYAGYWAFFWAFLFLWLQGYAVFVKGNWEVSTFIFTYGIHHRHRMEILKRTTFHKSNDVDLVSGLEFFDALTEYYRHEREAASVTVKDKFTAMIF